MKKALFAWIAASLLLLGAGYPAAAAPSSSSGTVSSKETKKAPAGEDQAKAENKGEEEQGEYTYNPQGKTDPFAAFVVRQEKSLSQIKESDVSGDLQKMLAILQDLKRPKTELQTIPLPAIRLTAIVKTDDQVLAMVRGPKGGKGFLVKKGTYIGKNGGVVEEIINEEKDTALGKQLVRKVRIKEPFLDKDRKISYRHVELKMPGSFD